MILKRLFYRNEAATPHMVVLEQKNKMPIFINVNLHEVDRVGPLPACPNCASKPTISFKETKIELEGLT